MPAESTVFEADVAARIFAIPRALLRPEMDRIDAVRASETEMSPRSNYALFVLRGLLRRRLEGVPEATIRSLTAKWTEFFAPCPSRPTPGSSPGSTGRLTPPPDVQESTL